MDIVIKPIREYQPRLNCMNHETTNPHTLKHRNYVHLTTRYYRAHADMIRQKAKDRYNNDPIYRARCNERAKSSYERRKQQAAQTSEINL